MDTTGATTMMFDHIDIFSIIYPYLDTKDQLNLLCVSKNIYLNSKGFRYLRLDGSGSQLFHENESFRRRMLGLVMNSNRQISLQLLTGSLMLDVNKWCPVHTLTLSGCHGIVVVSALGNVHTLTMKYCPGIVDVSALGAVHILALSYCRSIVDVSALGAVHILTLQGCRGIVGVSALGTVNTPIQMGPC